MARQQLPPQITKVTLKGGAIRYQVTTEAGTDPKTGKRRQTRKRYRTEKEARAALAAVGDAVARGAYVARSALTVEQACSDWLASKHDLKPSTVRGHKVSLGPVRDQLGHIELQSLTKRHLDDLVAALRAGDIEGRKKWSPRSVNYMLSLTTAVLEDQLQQGHIARNVAKLVKKVHSERPDMRTLSESDMFAILDHECRDQHLWTLALYGLRRGEIAGLRWRNVDLQAKTVEICENRVVVGREIITGTPKSKRSTRTLPLPDSVAEVLRAARKRQLEERLRLGSAYGAGEYVASDEIGEPYHPSLLTFRWSKLLAELGIERVRLHDARHSCATLMHLRGVPIAVIAAWLGHASAAFTMATYAHSQDPALIAAGASFGRDVTTRDTGTGPAAGP